MQVRKSRPLKDNNNADTKKVKIYRKKKQMKIKTQLEVIKECKRVPRINPPPPEFAELINMCMKVGVMSAASFDERPDDSISYWTVLKDGWKKENPDRPVFEGQ